MKKLLFIVLLLISSYTFGRDLSPQGSLNSLNHSNYLDIVRGKQPDKYIVHKFGAVQALGTTLTPVTSSKTYQTPTTAQALEILSSSANDASAGSGMWQVKVEGLDSNWELQSETVTMTGTSATALSNQYTRVFRMYGVSSGTYANATSPSHNSTITLRAYSAGATWATIVSEGSFGLGQSEIGVYSVPTGKKAYILGIKADIESNKSVTILMYKRENIDDVVAPYTPMRIINIERSVATELTHDYKAPVNSIQGPADIGFMASAAASADVEVDFEILVIDDDSPDL